MSSKMEYYRTQVSLARTEIKNLRQQLSALKHEHLKDIQQIKMSLNKLSCASCGAEATTVRRTITNGAQSIPENAECINYKPIGFIETSFQNKRGVPRQPTVMTMAQGSVVIDNLVFNNPTHALCGLEEFSHMWIIYHFHVTGSTSVPAKVSPPRLQGEKRGVYATRSPHRPCPIGLSLVKILKIEGNTVQFQGVDMVNGTPVLDLKPYIPLYDYPMPSYGTTPMSSLARPPTEGISDAVEDLANLTLGMDNLNRCPQAHLTNPVCTETSSPPCEPELPPEIHGNLVSTPLSPLPELSPSRDLVDGNTPNTPLQRREAERGAPDGQERFTPPQSALLLNMAVDGIRIAPWIANPPSQTFEVKFSDDALSRLNELIGDRAQAFKTNIEGLLSEDPRSQYVRTRYFNHEYNCVLEDLSITCVFDNDTSVCTIIAVRSAEELQQT